MLRKMMYMTFTFFVLSLFTYQNVCHAHMNENPEVFEGHTTTRNAWNSAYHDMNAKYQIMDNQYNIFTGAKSAVENLDTIWSDHQRKLAAGKTATVENVTNAFITLVGAASYRGCLHRRNIRPYGFCYLRSSQGGCWNGNP